ncbi:MAG: hypothetical protein A4E38_00873 [Methanoregulaceae archaeon PtaB.Bin108]|nr:MAG: hypothetical protein A4E38_00873 [Methanoregulaceae archaeon PtaB.Bin108]
MALTIADSEMHPTGTPFSSTGTWDILNFSMMSTACVMVSPDATLITGVCITRLAVVRGLAIVLRTRTILAIVLTLGSTLPDSIRATIDWLMPAFTASSACFMPRISRLAFISSGVGICICGITLVHMSG